MHDLVNDLAKFITGEFCFRLEIKESCEIARKTRHLSYVELNLTPLRNLSCPM